MDAERFIAAELHLDRSPELHRRKRGDVLSRHILLAAEASADQLILNHDALRCIVPSEHMQDFAPCVKCALVSRENLDPAFVRVRHSALGLEERMLCKRCRKLCGDRIGRLCERFGRVSSDHVSLLAEVAALVDSGRSFGSCLVNIANRLEHLVLDLDFFFSLFKNIGRFRDDEADGISDHPCRITLGDHDIPVKHNMSHFIDRHILCRQHPQHSRKRFGLLLVNLFDDRPRIIGSHC